MAVRGHDSMRLSHGVWLVYLLYGHLCIAKVSGLTMRTLAHLQVECGPDGRPPAHTCRADVMPGHVR